MSPQPFKYKIQKVVVTAVDQKLRELRTLKQHYYPEVRVMMTKIGDLEDYDDAPLDDALAVWQFVSAVHHCYHPEVKMMMTKIMR